MVDPTKLTSTHHSQQQYQQRHSSTTSITPKVDRTTILNKFREEASNDNIENEFEVNSFKISESPALKDRNIDFIHSPFQVIKNKGNARPVLIESSKSNQPPKLDLDSFKSQRHSGKMRSISSSSSSSSSAVSNSPKTNDSTSNINHFRNITPLNFEDAGRMQMEDTPISRRSNRSSRSNEFQFKKPIAHQRIRSIEEKIPIHQSKTPSNSRSTSPVKQAIAKQQSQLVSLTPAQRVEKHPGRLFNNANTQADSKSVLDSYEFKELLGKGASASVYKALNLVTGVEVAIKQIEINTKEDIELMMTEIRLLKILKHNNIVKYHGYVNNGQTLNIILEYCEGGSLRKLYKQRGKGLEEQEIIKYTKEILVGLNYLHEQGVIHRDVKGANVLLTSTGTVKLADFGVSSRANHKSSLVVGGSPYWMAPEVILLQGSSTASDIWSLGATVVELFTMQPPYHEFDPMAACHAIGIEENPPIPQNIPKLAKEFLLECFQKSPELRIDAKRLLLHPWLNDGLKVRAEKRRSTKSRSEFSETLLSPRIPQQRTAITPKHQDANRVLAPKIRNKKIAIDSKELLIGTKSPFREDNDAIKETDFEEINFDKPQSKKPIKKSNDEILDEFSEEKETPLEEDMFMNARFDKLQLQKTNNENFVAEDDPFLELEFQDDEFVDPKETKMISTVETLVEKLNEKNDDLIQDMVKLTAIMAERGGTMGKVFVRNHGLIRLLELLDTNNAEVNEHSLRILNLVFKDNLHSLENFCIIGGITSIIRFGNYKYSIKLRMEVVKFIEYIIQSNSTVFQMFIACGGLKILVKFVEEDIDTTPQFVLCGVNGIYAVFTSELPTSRSDFCFLLKDSVDWLAVNFSYLVGDEIYADKIVSILQSFSYSEPRVKSYIATTTLFKSVFKNYAKLSSVNKLKILKFISSLSSVPSNLNILDASNCLSFAVNELANTPPPKEGYKEIANAICPTVFNLCHLNKIRQLDLVELNAVPIFAKLANIELPFKDFIIPILSELVLINSRIRLLLWENKIFDIFTSYLSNPYWQVNSLDAIKNWLTLDDQVEKELFKNLTKFINGFQLTTNLNFLQNFLDLIGLNNKICQIFATNELIIGIFTKLKQFNKNAIIELTLLKILKKIIMGNKNNKSLMRQIKISYKELNIDGSSVLVMELIREIDDLV